MVAPVEVGDIKTPLPPSQDLGGGGKECKIDVHVIL